MASRPINIVRTVPSEVASPSSSYSSSSSSTGLYIPIHKRRSGSTSSGSSSFSSSSASPVARRLVYSREDLLILASSPLSHKSPDRSLLEAFPAVFKSQGGEIQRALQMTGTRQYNHHHSGRRGRRYRKAAKAASDSDDFSTRSSSSERW